MLCHIVGGNECYECDGIGRTTFCWVVLSGFTYVPLRPKREDPMELLNSCLDMQLFPHEIGL